MSDNPSSALDAMPVAKLRMVAAQSITRRHDALLQDPGWPDAWPGASQGTIGHWIDVNHCCNARLWAQEDLARRRLVPDAEIVANKRAIDHHNQQRNDAIEKLDELLLGGLGWLRPTEPSGALQVALPPGARLNSETVGSMIDRLSILALKIKAMHHLANAAHFTAQTRHAHHLKLEKLQEQRADLSLCLDALWSDAVAGRAGFKVYRQFKLYNDPNTNPALMTERTQERL